MASRGNLSPVRFNHPKYLFKFQKRIETVWVNATGAKKLSDVDWMGVLRRFNEEAESTGWNVPLPWELKDEEQLRMAEAKLPTSTQYTHMFILRGRDNESASHLDSASKPQIDSKA